MNGSGAFVAVDWGTTNRRAYKIDHGTCVDEFEDECGVLSIAEGGFPAAVAQIRARLGEVPLILAGMIGSTRGWVEVPYVACPADLAALAASLHWVEPGHTAIVPGLSVSGDGRADVMRGEEVQVLGALDAGTIAADSVVCHPGTHNKWVRMSGGRVTDFRTVMTGEMFGLLRERGILAEMLTGEVLPGEAFAAGVERGLQSPTLTAELFSVRARVLLGDLARGDAAAFVSGLLIGADVAVGLTLAGEAPLNIMGEPELTRLYAAAANQAGRAAHEIDGRAAFIAGSIALARTMT
jgi:2-dehydro-3-deoxygalactonokinase